MQNTDLNTFMTACLQCKKKKNKSARLHIAFSLQGDWDYKYGMQV